MKIALLGYGKEGKSAEKYFRSQYQDAVFDIFENETPEQLHQRDYAPYDMVVRSPSIPPLRLENETTLTRYFFDHCPCQIIGVTATKGKGTTCSFIKSLLDAEFASEEKYNNTNGKTPNAYLVGNIGTPAIEVLSSLTPQDIVVYEMSSFQLWDLKKSPHIAVIGQLEPDHLNVHKDYTDYLTAKTNITKYQTEQDYLIYYSENPETTKIANTSMAHKIPYPFTIPDEIKNSVKLPGTHNLNNAIAAIAAVATSKNISPDEYLSTSVETIKKGLSNFKGLPHRLEFIRELNGVKYYDDNFSTNPSSTRVAVQSFPDNNIIIIVGGRDKTNYEDIPEIYEILKSPDIKYIILLGESGHELARRYQDSRFHLTASLEEAVNTARKVAEAISPSIVLMSPAAASFDMFDNVYDRGAQYQEYIRRLK